ncbi:MAG TPA: TRAP transporter small permease [Candidatus Methylomirabilis sp.]|nr:TRAP transporter small permease [Candidatus Methylomirabilis sp.]
MIGRLRAVVERCNLALGMLSGLGILAMGLILTYEVVCRYFFSAPTIWAQETSTYLYMWTMLAAASYTLQTGGHVHVDLVIERLPGRVKMLTEVATGAVGTIFCAIVSVQAYQMIAATLRFGKVSATPLRVPLWIPQSALLMGFVLLTFQFAFLILDRLVELKARGGKEGVSA